MMMEVQDISKNFVGLLAPGPWEVMAALRLFKNESSPGSISFKILLNNRSGIFCSPSGRDAIT